MSNKSNATKSTKSNATKSNNVLQYDFTEYVAHINDTFTVDNTERLVNGIKNNNQLSLAKYANVMTNANSTGYVPTDAYVRFKNNTQFQLQYSKKLNKFTGFNIRLCANAHTALFKKWFNHFDTCVDNQRIIKTEFIGFDYFNEIINLLMSLPTYNRDVEIKTVTAK